MNTNTCDECKYQNDENRAPCDSCYGYAFYEHRKANATCAACVNLDIPTSKFPCTVCANAAYFYPVDGQLRAVDPKLSPMEKEPGCYDCLFISKSAKGAPCKNCNNGEFFTPTPLPSTSSTLPDSGVREQQPSGAVRDTQVGKGRFDLLEPEVLFRLAGAVKYADRNWEKGISVSRCVSSALRHLVKYLAGYRDEDHLAATVWNIAAIMRFEKDGRADLLDLPWQKHE